MPNPDILSMNFGEGVQKISMSTEPLAYVTPIYNQNPVREISKIKNSGNAGNYFNSEAFSKFQSMSEGEKQFQLKFPLSKGSIFDLHV